MASASDFEEDVPLMDKLLEKHTNINMHSNLTDSHIYILKNWVIKYLQHNTGISTIKGELLPTIAKKQHPLPVKKNQPNASIVNEYDSNDIFFYASEKEFDNYSSTYIDHVGDMDDCYHGDCIRCYAYIAPESNLGIRVNTLPTYWWICGKVIYFKL